jgi:tripartite-type tricarboxylate transporter receptor subunit TctC
LKQVTKHLVKNKYAYSDGLHMLACFLAFGGYTSCAVSQSQYPTKAIRIVVPFTAGGLTDILARGIGDRLSNGWGQPVVIDNRTGADGIVGAQIVSKAAPDGYTLLMIGISFAANPSTHRTMPYDTLQDFSPLINLADAPMVLAVQPQLKVNTVTELVTLARSKPNQVSYASGGNGSSQHLTAVLFEIMSKTDMHHIPYRGAAPAVLDLLGGRVDMMFSPLAASTQYAKAGRLKVLGVTSSKRVSLDPDLPTIAEAGVPGFEARAWFGLAVPAHVPKEVMLKLSRKIDEELRDPTFSKKLAEIGTVPAGGTPDEFAAFIRQEMSKYAAVVKKAGIKLD